MAWPEDVPPEEAKVIEELERRTADDLSPKLREDKSVFYRFCKARDFHIKDAEAMLRKHIEWRKEWKIDTILSDYEPLEVCKYATSSFVCFDKEGSLVRYFDMGNPDHKGMFRSIKAKDLLKYCFRVAEEDIELMRLHSIKIGKPVFQSIHIANFENLTLAKATHKKTLDTTLLFMKMFQDNYPERLKRIYHINASVYHNAIMSIVKTVMAAPLLQKIMCYGHDGWKEALLESIDADDLPAFLGGNRTDPDGNPLCKTFIIHGEKIPESYYLCNYEKNLSQAPGAKTLIVSRRSREEVDLKVEEPDSCLEWELEIHDWDKDIRFAVLFKDDSCEESKAVELVQKRRVDTCYGVERGSVSCQKAGTYVFWFDNTYSWVQPKEISYRVRVRGPEEDANTEWM